MSYAPLNGKTFIVTGAVSGIGSVFPVVVRLEGNNAEIGAELLGDSALNIIAATSFTDAAKKVVEAAANVKV